jgi:hypothetical protein
MADMENMVPIACTLTAADLHDRQKAWLKIGRYSAGSENVPGGLAVVFDAASGVDASLRELVRLEAECCAWMTFTLERAPGKVVMVVTGAGEEGERGVREAFAPLASAGPQTAGGRPWQP